MAPTHWTPPPIHGPSLRRGLALLDHPDPFARVFELAARRVPAAACAPLERRLRGHLLSWPRVCNVAQVPNDQCLALALALALPTPARPPHHEGEESGLSPRTAVARQEKLAHEFNVRGFVLLPNLACLSRPATRKRKVKLTSYFMDITPEGARGVKAQSLCSSSLCQHLGRLQCQSRHSPLVQKVPSPVSVSTAFSALTHLHCRRGRMLPEMVGVQTSQMQMPGRGTMKRLIRLQLPQPSPRLVCLSRLMSQETVVINYLRYITSNY